MTKTFHIWGRRTGKRATLEKWIQETLAAGHTVAVHTKDGIFCAKCDKDWETCNGSCYEQNN